MSNGESFDLDPQKMQEVIMEKLNQFQVENLQLTAAVRQLSEENTKLRVSLKSATATPSDGDTA